MIDITVERILFASSDSDCQVNQVNGKDGNVEEKEDESGQTKSKTFNQKSGKISKEK